VPTGRCCYCFPRPANRLRLRITSTRQRLIWTGGPHTTDGSRKVACAGEFAIQASLLVTTTMSKSHAGPADRSGVGLPESVAVAISQTAAANRNDACRIWFELGRIRAPWASPPRLALADAQFRWTAPPPPPPTARTVYSPALQDRQPALLFSMPDGGASPPVDLAADLRLDTTAPRFSFAAYKRQGRRRMANRLYRR
jgi:hypothetical protein